MFDKGNGASDIVDKDRAKILLRDYSKKCLRITRHCSDRMRLRDVSLQDINYVIMWGEVTEITESPEYQNYRCTVRGIDLDDDELTFIAAIDEKTESIICITVM